MSSLEPERRLAAILSADIAGYSRLMADDETHTVDTLAAYRSLIAACVDTHRGRLVDFTGDNFLAEFPSALDGVRCAVEIQRVLGARNDELPEQRRMAFRIGLHLGDIRVEQDRIYGDGVNIAARLQALGEPGGICISSNVCDLIRGKLPLSYRDLGEQQVKNIPQPVRAYHVSTDPAGRGDRRAAKSRYGTRVALSLGLVTLAVALAAVVVWRSTDSAPPGRPEAASALSKGPSIAVLPFANASGDPDQEYFSDGLTEDIITGLSKFQELFVIARHSTFQYKGGGADVRQVGSALGVRYVLEGSVRRAGERVRVTAQLSDTSNGRQLWGDAYDRDLTTGDLFELQDELTQQVVWAIAGSYGALSRAALVESRRKAPSNLDAYDCVLRTYEYLQVHNAANHLAARDCLELAVELDPDYADAWAWLAYTFAEEHRHQWNARPKSYAALDRALEVAEHAVELDRTNQVAYGVLALTYFGRREFDRFGAEAERAVALNPNNAIWLAMLGTYFAQLGDWERGLPMMQKALTLTPNPPGWFYIPFFLDHYRQHRYQAALAAARKIALEDYYRTHLFLAAAYGQLGRLEEATRELGELRARRPDFSARVGEDLFQHYGYPAELTEHLLEGLRKAGLEENRT